MSRLDDLPPDQRATLSLLLRKRKSYAEVASLLSIRERAVHDRAHAALAVLAAREARELTPQRRAEIGDYLLGQRAGVAERLATRTYLEGSPQAQAWARALAGELEPLAGASLPEIPGGGRGSSTAPRAAEELRTGESTSPAPPHPGVPARFETPSSRRGGALLLAGLVVAVVVAVVLIAGGGGSSHRQSTSSASAGGTSTSASTGTSSTSSQAGRAKEDKRITLRPSDPASKSIGVAEVLSEGNKYAFYLAAEHLPASKGFFYAVWLYNSPSSFEALSKSPPVGSNGRLQGGALLPANAGKYHRMLLTRETASRPTQPGPIVLSGSFALR
jgi:hypothetical protein